VEVLALLPAPLLSHLRAAVVRDHTLTVANDWGALHAVARRTPVDVAVVDPSVGGGVGAREVAELRGRNPSLPVVVYTALSAPALKAVVELARCGVEHVVLFQFDDDPRRLLELLERLPGYALSERLLEALGPAIGALPAATARALERLVKSPHRFFGAQDFAAAAGISTRTLYRQLEGAGLASPRVVVQTARLLRAYAYLRDATYSAKDVAAKLGYSSPDVLVQQAREATGLTPAELRDEVGSEELVTLLAERLTGRPPAPPAARAWGA
jgi:AraC-like DNA-binding protein